MKVTLLKTVLEKRKEKNKILEKTKVLMHLRVKSQERLKECSSFDYKKMLPFHLNLQIKKIK